MVEIICTRGYSGSGKSTWAKQYADEHGYEIVNRDSLRYMLLGSYWTGKPEDEERVTVAEHALVEGFVKAGRSVIVDATHLNPAFLRGWAKKAWRWRVDFRVENFHTPVSECMARDKQRCGDGHRFVGDDVILKQAKRFPEDRWPLVVARPRPHVEKVEPDKALPAAVIVDVDGTLTLGPHERSPYDYSKVHQDLPNKATSELVRSLLPDHQIIVMSGRDDDCRRETVEWLFANGVQFDQLFMRDTRNDRDEFGKLPDYDVKLRLFDENVRGQYDVTHVFDDRLQVCELWHEIGLNVFRVGDPNANF